MSTKKKNSIVSGRNIYQDEKGRNILYNKNTGVGYLIQEKDERAYNLYKNRYLYVLIGIILAVNFLADLWICIGVGVLFALFLEYRYRAKFIPSLVQITNFKPYENLSFVDQMVKNGDKNKILLSGILYIVFAILLVLNGIQMKLSSLLMIANIALACGAIVLSGIHFVAYTKMTRK